MGFSWIQKLSSFKTIRLADVEMREKLTFTVCTFTMCKKKTCFRLSKFIIEDFTINKSGGVGCLTSKKASFKAGPYFAF